MISATPERAASPVGESSSSEEDLNPNNENNNDNKTDNHDNNNNAETKTTEDPAKSDADKEGDAATDQQQQQQDQEVILIQDTSFTVKIAAPGVSEPFELQVSSMELVQEIHQVLMDREDTCHRTCFSLYIDGRYVLMDRGYISYLLLAQRRRQVGNRWRWVENGEDG